MKNNTITRPGRDLGIVEILPPKGARQATPTVGSAVLDFDKMKNLLSDKPLRRPNRTRPLD